MSFRWRRHPKLFSDLSMLQFAFVMCMVVFVILLFFMTAPTHHHGFSCDLAKVKHPISMPGADREDAMKVFVLRDGQVFFGAVRIDPADLHQKIDDRLKDHRIERKVYIVADMRTRWGSIKPVLDGIRAAGVLRIAFLADQCRIAPHI